MVVLNGKLGLLYDTLVCISMTSSSSCSSNIKIKSGPIDGDVLWMQAKHVSKHVWNGKEDQKLHIKRVVPTYQGEEEIPEEIIHLLRQSGFYWIMKMGYLKINVSLITVLIERWKPETHTFHIRCGDCTITLQDVSVLLGLHVDGAPLIGQTNLDWAELCEELLGVRPHEGELQGNVVKLKQLQRFTRAWILRFIEGVLFVDKSSSKVSLRYLQFLCDFEQCSMYAWGPTVLAFLYKEMCSAIDYKIKSIGGMCILVQMWAWERCTTLTPKRTSPVAATWKSAISNDDLIFLWEPYTATVMSVLPPICLVGSVAWCVVVPLICFHVVERHQPDRVLRQFGMQPIPECHSQPVNIHGLTLKGKQAENWFQLVDVYPQQEGLLSFNSDFMVWYRRKTKMFVDPKNANTTTLVEVVETLQYMVSPQGRNTWTVDDLVPYVEKITILSEEQERIAEPVAHGPALEHRFPPQEFHMLQSSVEIRGFDRQREAVEAQEFSQQIEERGHGMYYTPPTFSQYPSQVYQYPFEGYHTHMYAREHSFGGVAETHPHFSWPTMTPSQQHNAPMTTPNAPLALQWNVPGAIPYMGDLLGVDLCQEFSAEAKQVEAERHHGRRNPDHQTRRWDQPCGTSSRHHGHHNE
ncbi:Serine/threonine-protein phosphatase 7 long form [Glycine soja]